MEPILASTSLVLRHVFTLPLLLCSGIALAQPEVAASDLLFEPVLLPASGEAPARSLVAFAEAERRAAARGQMDASERAGLEAELARYRERIGEGDSGVVANPPELSADLVGTGLLYQRLGDHDNAVTMLRRALDLATAAGSDEVAIRKALAQSYRLLGQDEAADDMMDAAFTAQQAQVGEGSLELIPALLELGDWNTQAFLERSSIALNVPRMNVTQLMLDPRNNVGTGRDPSDSPLYKLYLARNNYLTGLGKLTDAGNYAHPGLMPLERGLLKNLFLHTHQENIVYEPDFYLTRRQERTASRLNYATIDLSKSENYVPGREVHQRIKTYIYNDENGTYRQLATAMLEEADWDLLFQHKPQAAEKYAAAYAFFAQNPGLVEELKDVLYPPLPVVLPVFLPAPNSREKLGIPAGEEVGYFGYIDVAIRFNEFGKTRDVDVLGQSGEVTRNMEIRLNQYLRNLQFRPRFTGTELDTGPVRLRYYIGI